MTTFLIFAKQGDAADVALAYIAMTVILVVGLIAAAIRGPANYDLLVSKNGLPYCPRCNRQVSYRRDYCRACGYTFKTYGAATTTAGIDKRYARDEEEAVWLADWLEDELQESTRKWEEKRARAKAESEARMEEKKQARSDIYEYWGIDPDGF